MSNVSVTDGIAFNSSRSTVNGRSTRPLTVRFHSPGRVRGHVADVQHGKPIGEVLAGRQAIGVVALLDQFLAVAVEETHALSLPNRHRVTTSVMERMDHTSPTLRPMSSMPPPPPPPMSPPPGYVAYGGPGAHRGAFQTRRSQSGQGDGRAAVDLLAAAAPRHLRSAPARPRGQEVPRRRRSRSRLVQGHGQRQLPVRSPGWWSSPSPC